MMSFTDFVHKFILKNKATSNTKICQVLPSLGLNDVGINLRDGPFECNIGIVSLHPSRGCHWVCYLNEIYFDSYGCVPNRKISKFIDKKTDIVYILKKIQCLTNKKDSFCGSCCLYTFYLTKVVGVDFISDVLNLYYQRIS